MPNVFFYKSARLFFFFQLNLTAATTYASVIDVPAGAHQSLDGETYYGNELEVSDQQGVLHGGVVYVEPAESGKARGVLDSLTNTNFYENIVTAKENHSVWGGAIDNDGEITLLDSVIFTHNQLLIEGENQSAYGGAIANQKGAIIQRFVKGSFVDNIAQSEAGNAYGDAIYNGGEIGSMENVYFSENIVQAHGAALGGALYHEGGTLFLSGMNTFAGNQASSDTGQALGGAIYMKSGDIIFSGMNFFSFNTADGVANDIYIENGRILIRDGELYLDGGIMGNGITFIAPQAKLYLRQTLADTVMETTLVNNGIVAIEEGYRAHFSRETFNNGLIEVETNAELYTTGIDNTGTLTNAGQYVNEGDIYLLGQGVFLNEGKAENSGMLSLSDNSSLKLGTQSLLHTGSYQASGTPTLELDVSLNPETHEVTHGVLEVEGDVIGKTGVILHFLDSDQGFPSMEGFLSAYVLAPNDNLATPADFKVSRIWGSPLDFNWLSRYNAKGDEKGSVWYLGVLPPEPRQPDLPFEFVTPLPEPPPRPSVYVPEVPVYAALGQVLYEQTRHLFEAVQSGFAPQICAECAFSSDPRGFVQVQYHHVALDKPSDVKGHIQAVNAGVRVVENGAYQAGVFGQYGKGKYSFSGAGDYQALSGAKMRVTDYVFGLYQQYQTEKYGLFGALYGGRQNMGFTTDDGVIDENTHAMVYGIGVSAARYVPLALRWQLVPSVSVQAERLEIADIHDQAGKTAHYHNPLYGEASLGVALKYDSCEGQNKTGFYIKPSVVQTFGRHTGVQITGMNQTKSQPSQTLGRLELGAEFAHDERISGYAGAAYTFGKDYHAYQFSAGVKIAF